MPTILPCLLKLMAKKALSQQHIADSFWWMHPYTIKPCDATLSFWWMHLHVYIIIPCDARNEKSAQYLGMYKIPKIDSLRGILIYYVMKCLQ